MTQQSAEEAPEGLASSVRALQSQLDIGDQAGIKAALDRLNSVPGRPHHLYAGPSFWLKGSGIRHPIELEPVIAAGCRQPDVIYAYIQLLTVAGDYASVISYIEGLAGKIDIGTVWRSLVFLGHARLGTLHPREERLAIALERERSQHWLPASAIKQVLRAAIDGKKPFSFVRLGDGEARFLAYMAPRTEMPLPDAELTEVARVPWLNWFGTDIHEVAPSLLSACHADVMRAIDTSDLLGITDYGRLRRDTWHFGYLSYMDEVVSSRRQATPDRRLTDAMGHYEIARSDPFLASLLHGLDFLGVISPHPELAERLAGKFGIPNFKSYDVPGEGRLSNAWQERLKEPHFPNRYRQIMANLDVPHEGALFLVAAGLLGKAYCARIKELGGIAIDIGSVADAWMGIDTRVGQMNGIRKMDLSRDQFIEESRRFRERLATCTGFNEVQAVWRSTSIPYAAPAIDPNSAAYRDWMLQLYTDLTEVDYAVENELTSTKQSAENFALGMPWVTRNLRVCADETSKFVQAATAVAEILPSLPDVIEFGSGWGNLALPFAKAGCQVSAVDIDAAFLTRLQQLAAQDGFSIDCLHGDFVEVAKTVGRTFDVAIFQSSFHHCIDFLDLLSTIRERVIKSGGSVMFLSEPIVRDYPFPWGLRYDGESLWAITANKWLELGFQEEYFLGMLVDTGFIPYRIDPIGNNVGGGTGTLASGYRCDFSRLKLPRRYDLSFHPSDGPGFGRFCKRGSMLPALPQGHYGAYEIEIHNYAPFALKADITSGANRQSIEIGTGQGLTISIPCARQVVVDSQMFVPHEAMGNGDMRELGIAVKAIRLV